MKLLWCLVVYRIQNYGGIFSVVETSSSFGSVFSPLRVFNIFRRLTSVSNTKLNSLIFLLKDLLPHAVHVYCNITSLLAVTES
jgi:hypothetical protein